MDAYVLRNHIYQLTEWMNVEEITTFFSEIIGLFHLNNKRFLLAEGY